MNNLKSFSDENLLSLLRQEDTEAFEEIYFRYWKKLYGAALKRISNKETCEEIVQDIFAGLWTKRKSLDVQNLPSYLFTSVKYKVINYLQHEIIKQSYGNQYLTAAPLVDNSTEELILHNDLKSVIDQQISKLPTRCQLVFKLSREGNLTMKQVALKLGISEKTVENQLGKAIRVLKINLKNS